MSERVTIYAREPAALSPAELLAALQAADLCDLAAELDPYLEHVDTVAEALRIDAGPGLDGACLHYRTPGLRPIELHRWVAPGRVAEALSKVRDAGLAPRVEAGLEGVVEVIAIEYCWPMLEDLDGFGAVLAWEAARVLAQATRGLVRSPEDGWWRVDEAGQLVEL